MNKQDSAQGKMAISKTVRDDIALHYDTHSNKQLSEKHGISISSVQRIAKEARAAAEAMKETHESAAARVEGEEKADDDSSGDTRPPRQFRIHTRAGET